MTLTYFICENRVGQFHQAMQQIGSDLQCSLLGISFAGLLTFLWMIHLNVRHNYNIFPRHLFHIYVALVHGMVCLSHNRVKFLRHYLCATLVQCSNYTPACLRLLTLHKIGNLLDLNFWSWHNLTNTSVHIFRATTNLVVGNTEFFFLFQVQSIYLWPWATTVWNTWQ